jgi:hypothetical protein
MMRGKEQLKQAWMDGYATAIDNVLLRLNNVADMAEWTWKDSRTYGWETLTYEEYGKAFYDPLEREE